MFKTHKMTNVHISEMSNILYGDNWDYLHMLKKYQNFDIFLYKLIEILDHVSPEVTVRILAKPKIKEP